MFKVLSFRPFIAFVTIILISVVLSFALTTLSTKKVSGDNKLGLTIVLDAGHGGRDDGCQGINTGVKEAELNLIITKKLEKLLINFGFKVVLTRKDKRGLYNQNVSNYKKSDMEKRAEIISKANPNLVVSIHLNSYPSNHISGAQAFYDKESNTGKGFADSIQEELKKNFTNAKSESNFGDYYILKCITAPTVIVECGYLSNPEEELLLQEDAYQNKLAYSIACGIINYFNVVEELSQE